MKCLLRSIGISIKLSSQLHTLHIHIDNFFSTAKDTFFPIIYLFFTYYYLNLHSVFHAISSMDDFCHHKRQSISNWNLQSVRVIMMTPKRRSITVHVCVVYVLVPCAMCALCMRKSEWQCRQRSSHFLINISCPTQILTMITYLHFIDKITRASARGEARSREREIEWGK